MGFLLTLFIVLVLKNDLASAECSTEKQYDYIIVGGGTTGNVIATRLSEDSNTTVLLLEAGGEPREKSNIPLLNFDQLGTEMTWNYTSTSQKHTGAIFKKESFPLYRGKGLGGTGSIDSMAYAHGSKYDYDAWKAAGNDGWGYDDLLPYFLKIENFIFPHAADSDSYHGKGGPITVSHSDFKTPVAEAFMAAASEVGQPIVDYNAKTQIGFTYTPNTVANGSRCNSYTCYLKPVMSRSNLKVQTHALVTKIVVNSDKRATGVEYTTKCTKDKCEKECAVTANKEVIISGGVYNTPQLLLLSGIGPEKALKDLKIDVVADRPGVGQNLQDHVTAAGQQYIVNGKVTLNKKRYDTQENIDEWHKNKTGPLTVSGAFETDCFYQSDASRKTDPAGYQDLEVFFNSDNIVGILKDYLQPALLLTMPSADDDVMTFLPTVMRPKSRGTVTLKSKNPFDHPEINPNLLESKDDIKTLAAGIQFALKIGGSNAFKKYKPNLYLKGVIPYCADKLVLSFGKFNDDYYQCVAEKLAIPIYHTSSSCKMGPKSDSMAVVDNTLKVHGITGLRVADASIMPNIVASHPTATCLVIGEKVSDMIKKEHGKQ